MSSYSSLGSGRIRLPYLLRRSFVSESWRSTDVTSLLFVFVKTCLTLYFLTSDPGVFRDLVSRVRSGRATRWTNEVRVSEGHEHFTVVTSTKTSHGVSWTWVQLVTLHTLNTLYGSGTPPSPVETCGLSAKIEIGQRLRSLLNLSKTLLKTEEVKRIKSTYKN